jgi:hypothetical protein
VMKWTGHGTRVVEKRNTYRVSIGETWSKEPPGRPSSRWEDNIKMDLKEMRSDWTRFMWLMICPRGDLLWTRGWTFGFYRVLGISWLAEELSASQKDSASSSYIGLGFLPGNGWDKNVFF